MIAKRSKNVAGGCSEAETPGTESLWKTHPEGMPETVGPSHVFGCCFRGPIGPLGQNHADSENLRVKGPQAANQFWHPSRMRDATDLPHIQRIDIEDKFDFGVVRHVRYRLQPEFLQIGKVG